MQTALASKCTHQAKSLDKFGGSPRQPSLLAQMVKCLPAMREAQVQSLGWEDPLEKRNATHFSILAWRIPWIV